jgi:hypothetical protein
MKHILASLLLCLSAQFALAASSTSDLPITVHQKLTIVFTPAAPIIDCTTAPGSVVSALSATGGNGKPVGYSITGGNSTDFALNGTNVVVGPNGIATATCGSTAIVTITATQ